jgi:hypothetical protein
MSEETTPHTPLSPQAEALIDWMRGQDKITAEALARQMRHINEHYDTLYRKNNDASTRNN